MSELETKLREIAEYYVRDCLGVKGLKENGDKEKVLITYKNVSNDNSINVINSVVMDLGAEVMHDIFIDDSKGRYTTYDSDLTKKTFDRAKRGQLPRTWDAQRTLRKKSLESADYHLVLDKFHLEGNYDPFVVSRYLRDVISSSESSFSNPEKQVIGIFPTAEKASNCGMNFEDFVDLVYSSTVDFDWDALREKMKSIKEVFDRGKEIRIYSEGMVDITFNLEGRSGKASDGKINLIDGEVFYAPVENSINGYIRFQHPVTMPYKTFSDLSLIFENGKVVDYFSSNNKEYLDSFFSDYENTRNVGEFAVACNEDIKSFTNLILMDEKIDGTIHFALGYSHCNTSNNNYMISERKELGDGEGLNNTGFVHVDMVYDLRKGKGRKFPGGEIYVDGKLVQKDGIWKI